MLCEGYEASFVCYETRPSPNHICIHIISFLCSSPTRGRMPPSALPKEGLRGRSVVPYAHQKGPAAGASSFLLRPAPRLAAGSSPPLFQLSRPAPHSPPLSSAGSSRALRPACSLLASLFLRPFAAAVPRTTRAGHLHCVPPGVGPELDIFPVPHPMVAGVGPELDIFTASHQE